MSISLRFFKTILILFCTVLVSSCHNIDHKNVNGKGKKFKISNIENTINENDKNIIDKQYDAYRTKFILANLSDDTFTIITRSSILPQNSIGWEGGKYKINNYEHYTAPVKNKTAKFLPLSSIPVRMKIFDTSLYDSILYRPELVLNNRRFRLNFMFRKDEDETGYYLRDSISIAEMMKDTITDYANRKIRDE